MSAYYCLVHFYNIKIVGIFELTINKGNNRKIRFVSCVRLTQKMGKTKFLECCWIVVISN